MPFKDSITKKIFEQDKSKAALKRLPDELWGIAKRKLSMVVAATRISDLKSPPSNRLHALTGDRKGQHAISINDKYRIAFVWDGIKATQIEVIDYH